MAKTKHLQGQISLTEIDITEFNWFSREFPHLLGGGMNRLDFFQYV